MISQSSLESDMGAGAGAWTFGWASDGVAARPCREKEPDASSSDDCEIIEPPSPAPVPSAPVDYMTMSSAQAMAMTIVGGHGDVPPSAAPVAAPAPGSAAEEAAAPAPAPS